MNSSVSRPAGVTVIAIVSAGAALLTALFWGFVLHRLFLAGHPAAVLDRSSLGSTLGFLTGDLAWALLLLVLSFLGLLRMRFWGWLAAQMTNILWLYSMTVVWIRDVYMHTISPGALLFLPFVPFSVWAFFYLWKTRNSFKK